MIEDFEGCYRAVQSRDGRFDGWFYTAVTSTGIYCRPSCPAMTPRRSNVRFYPSAAAAQSAGFRACRRCRPDTTPGSPEWNTRADVVGRAMRLIADGVVDREGVGGLAQRLGYSPRHLHRQLAAEVGAGPIALARSQRAHTARLLIETTDLPYSQVAFAAGFSSIRQFNDTVRAVFGATPTVLGRSGRASPAPESPTAGEIHLRLAYRPPLAGASLFAFLGARAVPGVEHWDRREYRRTLSLPHDWATMALSESDGCVACRLRLRDLRDLGAAVQRARRLLDLDADPVAIAEQLGDDPLLGPAISARPGLRVPGCADGPEIALRAVLGQQVTVAGARRLAGRLTEQFGKRLPVGVRAGTGGDPDFGQRVPVGVRAGTGGDPDFGKRLPVGVRAGTGGGPDFGQRVPVGVRAGTGGDPDPGLTTLFPSPGAIAMADPTQLGLPAARGRALIGLAAALARGDVVVDSGADRAEVERRLVALPGIGRWTAAYVALRALGDPDAFLPSDLGVRRALERAGRPASPTEASRLAERWRPWRAYALLYLWALPRPVLRAV